MMVVVRGGGGGVTFKYNCSHSPVSHGHTYTGTALWLVASLHQEEIRKYLEQLGTSQTVPQSVSTGRMVEKSLTAVSRARIIIQPATERWALWPMGVLYSLYSNKSPQKS